MKLLNVVNFGSQVAASQMSSQYQQVYNQNYENNERTLAEVSFIASQLKELVLPKMKKVLEKIDDLGGELEASAWITGIVGAVNFWIPGAGFLLGSTSLATGLAASKVKDSIGKIETSIRNIQDFIEISNDEKLYNIKDLIVKNIKGFCNEIRSHSTLFSVKWSKIENNLEELERLAKDVFSNIKLNYWYVGYFAKGY